MVFIYLMHAAAGTLKFPHGNKQILFDFSISVLLPATYGAFILKWLTILLYRCVSASVCVCV